MKSMSCGGSGCTVPPSQISPFGCQRRHAALLCEAHQPSRTHRLPCAPSTGHHRIPRTGVPFRRNSCGSPGDPALYPAWNSSGCRRRSPRRSRRRHPRPGSDCLPALPWGSRSREQPDPPSEPRRRGLRYCFR